MTDDPTEWVTIKIPHHIRNNARDDPRTYGEIMQAGLGEDANGMDGARDVEELMEQHFPEETIQSGELLEELRKTRDLIDQVPERTADEVEDRFQ